MITKSHIRLMMSVCPHVTARITLKGYPFILILVTFMNVCRETPDLAKTGHLS
jgi:hypothetical protein